MSATNHHLVNPCGLRGMKKCVYFTGFMLLLLLGNVNLAVASSPQLSIIMPRGIQRGQEHVLTFSGARLQETQEVFFYSEGVTVKNIEQVDDKNVKVTVTVAPQCRLGEHVAQLRTTSGISDYRTFFVGALPAVAEAEPNNEFEKPQVIEHNVTVTGTITSEDVDHFQIKASAGQRISIEVEGIRLGNQLVDPFLAVLDEKRFEVFATDDTPLLKQDCFISFVAETDAVYTILLRDSAYGGNGNCHYRMHVGQFPRPKIAFPAGAPSGKETEIQLLGDPTGPLTHAVTVQESEDFRNGLFYEDEHGVTPSPVKFRVSELSNVLEAEPNSGFENSTVGSFPAALNGILQENGDRDWFQFEGKKGQVINIRAYAQQIGSPLDIVVNIYGPDKKHIQGNDDARGADSFFRFTVPADGIYYLRIRDLLERGGADFVYRLELTTPSPSLYLTIPRVSRYSQYRQSIFIPKGNRFGTLINALRGNFAGELKLLQDNLPPGITMHAMPMAANLNAMPVVFEAAEDAEISGALVKLLGQHVDEAKQIEGSYNNIGHMVGGPPNNTQYVGCRVNRLPMAVIKPLPFRIEIVQPKGPLVREGSKSIKVIAHRDEGFTAPITLQFPFRPPGVGTRGSIKIEEGKTEALYPLNANANAQIREWPIYVLAESNVGGSAWASSQLATLNVTERYVTFEISRAACEQGQNTQFICKINHLTPFEGKATAELVGLPPHAVAPKLEFDKTTEQLVFDVQTKAETPAGKHTGVFCRVRIPIEEEVIVATAGKSDLQIDRPLPKKQVAAKPAPPKPVKTTEKPLSRLEKLRQAARDQKGSQ